ncbi:hypothetical protein T484DRAFT_2084151 [Baffinella frigidus]|nr:hypothetical protein T484DRAFT_2084151 [Cryptophyta sp. CCMP2293]
MVCHPNQLPHKRHDSRDPIVLIRLCLRADHRDLFSPRGHVGQKLHVRGGVGYERGVYQLVQGLGFGVWVLVFRFWGLRFGVWGLEFMD